MRHQQLESPPRTAIRVSLENERTILRQGTSWLSLTDEELDAVLDAVENLKGIE